MYFQTDKRTMVKINIKYQDESEFWFETPTSTRISDLSRDVNVIFKNKHLLQALVKDVEKFVDRQTSLPEKEGLGTNAPEETASSQQEESLPVCFYVILKFLKLLLSNGNFIGVEFELYQKKYGLREQFKLHCTTFKNRGKRNSPVKVLRDQIYVFILKGR
jgi:hypothetical protein